MASLTPGTCRKPTYGVSLRQPARAPQAGPANRSTGSTGCCALHRKPRATAGGHSGLAAGARCRHSRGSRCSATGSQVKGPPVASTSSTGRTHGSHTCTRDHTCTASARCRAGCAPESLNAIQAPPSLPALAFLIPSTFCIVFQWYPPVGAFKPPFLVLRLIMTESGPSKGF